MKNILKFRGVGFRNEPAFSLIAVVTVMTLLALISVAMLTMAASVSKGAQRGRWSEEARAQARLALEIALGRLQCELGPDQRISASSGILSDQSDEASEQGVSSPHILGVWQSWDGWLNRENSKGRKITDTYKQGRDSMFRSWLISSANLEAVRNWNSVTGSQGLGGEGSQKKGKVVLLGKGTLGNTSRNDHIYADLVAIDTSVGKGDKATGGQVGHIAWWVSGENLKARINLPVKGNRSSSDIEILRRSWDTPSPDVSVIPGLERVAQSLADKVKSTDETEKIISFATLSLLNRGNSESSCPFYHIASLNSSGLIADVRCGGLKKDLNMLLSQPSLEKTNFYEEGGADVSIRPYGMADVGSGSAGISNSGRPLASWKQMFYWYNLWSGQVMAGQDRSSPLYWQGKSPATRIASDPELGVMNNRFTYMRQPVLLKMYVFLGFVLSFHDTYDPFDGLDCQMGARPVYVWWNPYNVPLEIGTDNQTMGAFGAPYRVMPVQQSSKCETSRIDNTGNNRRFNYPWLKYSEDKFSVYDGGLVDQGNSFRKDQGEKKITFAPGEIKVFSQDMSYDMANNCNKVFNRNLDHDVDANHYVHRFEGHEITYKQVNKYAPTNVVPALFKYTTAMGKPSEDPTPGNFICLHWMWRTDLIRTYLDLRLPAGMDGLLRPIHGEKSIYQLFLKESSSDKRLNFAIGAGIMKDGVGALSESDLNEGKAIEKYFPSFMNINWMDEKPYGFIKGNEGIRISESLFNVMWNGDGMPARMGGAWGEPNNDGNPFWLGHYGISPKSVNGPADHNSCYKGEDARNKVWQHSSPIFWGSQLPNPTKLLRKHHPYQFELKLREPNDYTQLDIISGDIIGQVVSNSETGSGGEDGLCYFGYRDEDMVSTIVASELPVHPPFSLAGFATARLTPGWYDETKVQGKGEKTALRARRISYQSGVPGVGIGNSLADPMIPADQVHYNYTEHDPELADFWDHAFLNNDALWDTWYTSSISRRPSYLGGTALNMREVVTDFIENYYSGQQDEKKELSNSRFRFNPGNQTKDEVINELTGDQESWEKSAKYLTIDGAFNVNSTSVDAWVALLNGLKNRGILFADKKTGEPRILSDSLEGSRVYLKRFAVASSDHSRYDEPMLRIAGENDSYSWSDLRTLKPAGSARDGSEIHELARQIVLQVKKRGPFLNMSEFVNRRLTTSSDHEFSNKGALQAAIDAAGLNDAFNSSGMMLDAYNEYKNSSASAGSVQTASPGYLVQSDILSVLGNTLTVRDDTFTVRAYGQVTDPSGVKIRGRAWCEAVVQRCVDYVNPADDPEKGVLEMDLATGDYKETNLLRENKTFGRKFRVVSFRWLSPEEV